MINFHLFAKNSVAAHKTMNYSIYLQVYYQYIMVSLIIAFTYIMMHVIIVLYLIELYMHVCMCKFSLKR